MCCHYTSLPKWPGWCTFRSLVISGSVLPCVNHPDNWCARGESNSQNRVSKTRMYASSITRAIGAGTGGRPQYYSHRASTLHLWCGSLQMVPKCRVERQSYGLQPYALPIELPRQVVGKEGIEPPIGAPKASVLPLYYFPDLVVAVGIEPTLFGLSVQCFTN